MKDIITPKERLENPRKIHINLVSISAVACLAFLFLLIMFSADQ